MLDSLILLTIISDESDCDSNCYCIDEGSITIEVPAAATDGHAQVFSIPNFFPFLFQVIDDEYEQSFAIVAELGPDVPDRIAYFQLQAGECFGRRGATDIRITDNDCYS